MGTVRALVAAVALALAGYCTGTSPVQAQNTIVAGLLPNGMQQFVDSNGAPLAGGSVGFYVPGTLTLKSTWQDPYEQALNVNPVVLDQAGRALIYGAGQYREIVKDVNGNTIWDQLTNSGLVGSGIGQAGDATVFASAGALADAGAPPNLQFATVAALRANTSAINGAFVSAYATVGDGGGGQFVYNPNDVTSADNSCTIIVDAAQHRFYAAPISGPVNVRRCGATGNGTTDDTGAFQAAWNIATAAGTSVYVPAANSGECYNISAINGTNFNPGPVYPTFNAEGFAVFGDGDQSALCVNPSAAGGNWWDLSGSQGLVFRDLSIRMASGSPPVPGTLFLWAASTANTGQRADYLNFTRVDINAQAKNAFLFAYATAYLVMRDETWVQTYNGVSASQPLSTSIVKLDGLNTNGVTSSNVTLQTGNLGDEVSGLRNVNLIEDVPGLSGASNDSVLMINNAGETSVVGGSLQGQGLWLWVIWSNSEAVTDVGTTQFESPTSNLAGTFIDIGGGFNDTLSFVGPWFSQSASGTLIQFEQPVAGAGGTGNFNLLSPNPGGGGTYMISVAGNSCSSTKNPWIYNSHIDLFGLSMITCGSVYNTELTNPGTITVPAGSSPGLSLGSDGFRENTDGTIEQWGQTGTIGSSSSTTITFSEDFRHAVLSCQANSSNSSGGNGTLNPNIGPTTLAQLTLVNPSSSVNIGGAFWRCIGY